MKFTKDRISALTLPPDTITELLELFDEVEAKQTEVDSIRAKLPSDSQKIVESVDYDKFMAATTELQTLKDEMAGKLNEDGGKEGGFILSAFSQFFS